MTKTTVSDGQSLVDVALQELGSVEAVFDLADANGLAITDPLTPGQVLAVPESAAVPAVVDYFRARAQRINVGDEPQPPLARRQRYFSNLFFNVDFYA